MKWNEKKCRMRLHLLVLICKIKFVLKFFFAGQSSSSILQVESINLELIYTN